MRLSTWSWSGVVLEKEANTTHQNLNRRFAMLNFQQAISFLR